MKKYISKNIEDTNNIAKEWLQESILKRKDTEAYVVGLSGHLGAGKTAFVKCVAKELGINNDITSPTFVIMKIYDIDNKNVPWHRLVHIDAYRLESREELQAITFEKIVSDPYNLVIIEWPENVAIKNDYANISFQILEGDEGREIEVN